MYSRKQYMNGEVSHEDYWAQFVTEYVKASVLNHFNVEDLSKSYEKDKYLNNIGLKYTGGRTTWDMIGLCHVSVSRLIKAGEVVSNPTPSDAVCIAKSAARILIEEYRAALKG